MRSNILERRKRLARRSISLVDAMYEFSVTKKADEIWTSCITSSGDKAISSEPPGCESEILINVIVRRLANRNIYENAIDKSRCTNAKLYAVSLVAFSILFLRIRYRLLIFNLIHRLFLHAMVLY